MRTKACRVKEFVVWLREEAPRPAVGLAVVAALIFLGLLFKLAFGAPPAIDEAVFRTLQGWRSPGRDGVMVLFTEFGDQGMILPLAALVFAWLAAHRLWRSAAYWIVAVGGAEFATAALKFVLHRPRPGAFFSGNEQYSFPSGHALMGVVVYGLLAWFICRHAGARLRAATIAVTVLLLALIDFSRLYLGAHWCSDVLAGLAFGLFWVTLVALLHAFHCREAIPSARLARTAVVIFVLVGAVHVSLHHKTNLTRYAPVVSQGQGVAP
jgi:membrane-associated phospholipid phosphatase